MNKNLLLYPPLFLLVVVLQTVVFNGVAIWGYVNLYPYVIFLLLLPLGWKFEYQLLVAFAMGICIDLSLSSLGLHAAASTLLAFSRYPVVRRLESKQRDALLDVNFPPAKGLAWSFYYVLLIVAVHHFAIFILSAGPWTSVPHQLLQYVVNAVISTLFTSMLILMILPLSTFRR